MPAGGLHAYVYRSGGNYITYIIWRNTSGVSVRFTEPAMLPGSTSIDDRVYKTYPGRQGSEARFADSCPPGR